MEPLKEQAEVAKRYRSILEELKTIEINIMLNSIDKFRNRLHNAKQDAENIQSLINAKTSSMKQLEQKA